MASIKDARKTPTQISRMTHRGNPFTVKSVNSEMTESNMEDLQKERFSKIQPIVTAAVGKINIMEKYRKY